MEKYFRIIAYHPQKNISTIIDSRNMFDKPSEINKYFSQKGFTLKVLQLLKNIDCENIPPFINENFPYDTDQEKFIGLVACERGETKTENYSYNMRGAHFSIP